MADTPVPTTPKLLTITFKIHVKKSRSPIREAKVQAAAEQIISGVLTLLPRVFPWADRVEVDRSWVYDWWTPKTEKITLPVTAQNSPADSSVESDEPGS